MLCVTTTLQCLGCCALQNAQRTGLWRGVVRGALKAVQTASIGGYKAGMEAGGSCNEES